MADTQRFNVIRRHLGDLMYEVGDTREGTKSEFKHLIGTVLEEPKTAKKAEAAPLNKAESAAPANKADTGRKAK
jgi:hypothetical protein